VTGVRQKAADTKSVPVNEDESKGSSAAEMLALAEEAEAEAAEAEALAAAARARGRAIKLRRDADLAQAKTQQAATKSVPEEAVTKEAVPEEEADSAASASTEVAAIPEIEPDDTVAADAPEGVQTEESAVDEEGADEAETADEAVAESDEVEDADEESADDERPVRLSSRRLSRPRWSTVAAVLAMVVTVAALSASVYMVLGHRRAADQRQHAAEFAAAAKQGVVTLTSLDFNDAKSGVQHIVENATGTFKDDFLKMSGDFVKVVEQSKVISRGTVQAAAVDLDTMTKDSAVVLVACTSEVTNAAGAKQDPRTYRLIVTMTREGGQLKMSKVEFVP
jgi:Mce-associated membrane protein